MSTTQQSAAVAVARAHVEAWSSQDFDKARELLAPDVRVTATTTAPYPPDTDLTGVDDYMAGLVAYAQPIKPGSMRVLSSVGDERNALLMLTVEADFGGGKMILPGARLYLLDDDTKIKSEQVIFFGSPE